MLNINQVKASGSLQDTPRAEGQRQFGLKDGLRVGFGLLAFIAALFLPAGRWDLPMFWAYWLIFCVVSGVTLRLVNRKYPDLLKERFRPGPGGRDPWSRPLVVLLFLGHWIVAGLDVGRYHWSDDIPIGAQTAALVAIALGMAGWAWAMMSNQFFSSDVRIQTDRGHHVQSGGPYRFVRHPGYAAALLVFAASPVALGSLWAIAPTLGTMVVFVRRTALEDRMLRAELPGYAEYAERVRFRLLSGVW